MTINYWRLYHLSFFFKTQVQWINPAALSLMAGNPSKISDRILRYNFAKTVFASIDWLIHWTIYWQNHSHTGWEGSLVISNPSSIQSRPWEVRPAHPLFHLVWKISKAGVYTPSPAPKAASLSFWAAAGNLLCSPVLLPLALPSTPGKSLFPLLLALFH